MGLNYLNTIARRVFGRGEIDYYRYFDAHAIIRDFKSDIDQVVYEGCPEDDCQKKVWPTETDDGLFWYCPKCNYYYTFFQYRYKLKVFIEDGSRTIMVTMFDDTAKPLLGISAPDIAEVHERSDYDEYDSFFCKALDQMCYFTLRAALVIFRDKPRLNCIIAGFEFDEEN